MNISQVPTGDIATHHHGFVWAIHTLLRLKSDYLPPLRTAADSDSWVTSRLEFIFHRLHNAS